MEQKKALIGMSGGGKSMVIPVTFGREKSYKEKLQLDIRIPKRGRRYRKNPSKKGRLSETEK